MCCIKRLQKEIGDDEKGRKKRRVVTMNEGKKNTTCVDNHLVPLLFAREKNSSRREPRKCGRIHPNNRTDMMNMESNLFEAH